jgi:aspartyl-tRNA synthetase
MVFVELRTGGSWAIQGIAAATADGKQVSKQMVKWIGGIKLESLVEVEAIVQKPIEPVKSTRVSGYELHFQKVYLVQTAPEQLGLTFASASIRPGRIEDDEDEDTTEKITEKTEGLCPCPV